MAKRKQLGNKIRFEVFKRDKFTYIVEWEAIKMLEEMYLSGVELSCMRSICENSNSWSEFKQDYNDVMGEQ